MNTQTQCGRSVLDLLQEASQARPDSVAIEEAGCLLTYAELNRMANLLAGNLLRRGLRPEEPVAILLPASGEYVVAMLAILKAGGSYLPIDPGAPLPRQEFILQDSRSRFALTNASGTKRLAQWSGTALCVDQITGETSGDILPFTSTVPAPNHRAYIIYTSGSTGQPKGVEIEHHSLTNLICAYRDRLELSAQDRTTLFANVAFDVSVADVWPTLCSGGTLVIPPQGLAREPDRLIAWLHSEKITWSFVPTGLVEILFARPWPAKMPLRYLVTAGDRLRLRPPQNVSFTAINGYGPTENTVLGTWAVVEPQDGTLPLPSIGRALPNVKTYVLDENRQPAAEGQPGELHLGGDQVARGYFGNPALTAERFLPDPFTGEPNDRMYRTGDWVRWLPDGELDFLGRHDDQVQIRGYRVELGEIEAALLEHPSVRQACCLPRSENGVATGLVAHLVLAKEAGDASSELSLHLSAKLPAYMQPSRFVFHPSLPLTANGKVDRTALVSLHPETIPLPQAEEGTDGLEIALSRLWHTLLPEARRSPAEARFPMLGGDSLVLVNLMLGVEEITGQALEASDFLLLPTFAGLCQAVNNRMAQTEFQPVLTLRKQGTRPPLFFLHQQHGDLDHYFELAEALGEDQPVFGIRSPALQDLSRLPSSIEAAATEIIAFIRKVMPEGAPSLVGFSWSGLLAYEIARQLAETEGVFCFTALLGGDPPMPPTGYAARLLHFARYFPPWFLDFLLKGENRWQRLTTWPGIVRKGVAKAHLPLKFFNQNQISRHMLALTEKYYPSSKANLPLDLFRERESYAPYPHPLYAWQTSHLPDGGWNRWTRQRVRVHWVEGDHFTVLNRPAVTGLAQSILRAMDQHFVQPAPRVGSSAGLPALCPA